LTFLGRWPAEIYTALKSHYADDEGKREQREVKLTIKFVLS